MPENVQSQVRLFADDTAIYLAVGKLNNPQQLQDDLNQLQKWKELWDMEFNPGKYVVMHISGSKPPINSHSHTMHSQTLDTVDTARYLGVDISSNLNFNQQINMISSNANKTLAFLKRNLRTKTQMYVKQPINPSLDPR